MVFAYPIFDDGRSVLRFKNTAKESVTLTHVIIRPDAFVGGAVPQILKSPVDLPVAEEVDCDITNALIQYVANDDDTERTTGVHFDLSYTPKDDDQPDGLYFVTSRGRKIIGFTS
jgi:hypothetical protein